jgi:uncharacterized protein YuzE
MKLTIDKEADALYLDLDETPAVESEEISPGVILDYNSEGKVTGIEPESAAADVDRSPRRPNALFVQTRVVFAVGQSRGRAAGAVGCLLSDLGAWRPEVRAIRSMPHAVTGCLLSALLMNYSESKTMNRDPIVDEVRKNRREILEAFGGDFSAMVKDAMIRQWKSGHKVVTRSPKRPSGIPTARVAEAPEG